MTVSDIYKVIKDTWPAFIYKPDTDEWTRIENWNRLEQYWLDRRVIELTKSPFTFDKTILITVE